MTRRTRNFLVIGGALATLGLAGGGIALAADGDEPPREQVRFVVEENGTDEDCPWKNGGTTPTDDPASEL